MLFTCPKCGGKLNIGQNAAASCSIGHSFDRSRYGYYNLLLSGGAHGDNKDMVIARRAFLGSGYYEPLAVRIGKLVSEEMKDGGVLLDAGCGEGYYTLFAKRAAAERGARVAAFDISKDAVREAAKRGAADCYAVASSYHIPMESESVDLVMNTFSPMASNEVLRILRPGGVFLMAIVAEEHLFGLKQAIYDTPYKNTVEDTALEGFRLILSDELRFPLKLEEPEAVKNLFMMTPYAYRTSREGRERVLSLSRLECEAHFRILMYRKI